MPSQQQTRGPDAPATSYRSTACQIGTHRACAESSPDSAPVDLPLIYEACDCTCHSASGQPRPGRSETTSATSGIGSASGGTPASNAKVAERHTQG
ncbi:hypothetical protein DN051_41685 (plasmid) [Streptomyces cadmiisoli]|uniref:Uncharacterized protein n=1 Tax=Streptomyces cadmiisoli TaxID=2184053 RepID=A0A2Z4JDY7_9ACTN|nr:hypothetical protein DN051_41685 [Streptomyces cadmiisoli]